MNSFSFFYIFCFYSTIFSTIYTDFQLSLKISFFALNLGILLCFLILLVIPSSLACIALRSQFQLFFSLLFWTSFFTEDEALSVAFCLLVCVLCFFFLSWVYECMSAFVFLSRHDFKHSRSAWFHKRFDCNYLSRLLCILFQ